MRLTYWVATIKDDHPCYSVRSLTKKGCVQDCTSLPRPGRYEKPKKVVVEYAGAFDLLTQILSEGWHEG